MADNILFLSKIGKKPETSLVKPKGELSLSQKSNNKLTKPELVSARVQLSGESHQIQSLSKLPKQIDTVDYEKVAKIQRLLAAGDYPLDVAKIAARFTELEGFIKPMPGIKR